MSKHASPAVIGAFVVTALALVLAAVLILGGGKFFRNTARVIVYFDGSVEGLRIGAPVKFRGLEIGTVKDLRISMSGAVKDPAHMRIPALLEIDESRLDEEGVGHINLRDRKEVARLVGLGLRAQLATESLVTGVRYVSLDMRPGTPAVLSHDGKYPEIPSARSTFDEIPDKVTRVLDRLAAVDLARLVDDADRLLRAPGLERALARLDEISTNVNATVRDIGQTVQQLGPAISDLTTTAASTRTLMAPNGMLSAQLDSTLREIQTTARSMRRLTDQLSRDPGAIVRGGKP